MKEIKFYDIPLQLVSKEIIFKKINYGVKNRIKTAIVCTDFRLSRYNHYNPLKVEGNYIFYPDSTGMFIILKTLWRENVKSFKKLISTDIHFELLSYADLNNYSIFLFGDTTEVLERMILRIQKQYKRIKILGHQSGFNYSDEKVIEIINYLKPDIVLIGMGVPKQELWILDNYTNLTNCVIITVGAFFSFFSGKISRAPKFFRILSLEWLYRLFQEPLRLATRYFYEFPQFFLISVKNRIQKNDSSIYS